LAFSQLATGISVISSGLKGYQAISLSDITLTTASVIESGSAVEIGNAFFLAGTTVTPNASSWTAITTATTAFLALTPSGTAGSQTITAAWDANEPVWVTSKNGYYASAASISRVVALAYKVGPASYRNKTVLPNIQGEPIKIDIEIGTWDMSTVASVNIFIGVSSMTNIRNIQAVIFTDGITYCYDLLTGTGSGSDIAGWYRIAPTAITLYRVTSGDFDDSGFDDTTINRGYMRYDYYIK